MMNDIEYIEKKNKIVFNATGLTLVPKDQIKDSGNKARLHINSTIGAGSCPYCKAYNYFETGGMDCSGCPMAEAGNLCELSNKKSTWTIVKTKLDSMKDTEKFGMRTKLHLLAEEYNIGRE